MRIRKTNRSGIYQTSTTNDVLFVPHLLLVGQVNRPTQIAIVRRANGPHFRFTNMGRARSLDKLPREFAGPIVNDSEHIPVYISIFFITP